MKKIVLLAFVLVLLSTAIVWGFIGPTVGLTNQSNGSYGDGKFALAGSKTIWVPDNFTSIQEAVNNASDGDTIFVRADTYYENVVVNKAVSLIGENRSTTIIDGSGKGTVVSVTTDNVTIKGFTMQNSGKNGYWSFLAGIYLHSSNNKIAGNAIMSNNYGIIVATSYAKGSDKNTIADNIIQNNNYGILAFGKGNVITGNTVTDNNHHGIWFQGLWGNDSNTVTGNIISNSRYGISLVSVIVLGGVASSNLRHNILQFSSQPPFPPLSNNTVSSNIVTGCEYGIGISYLKGSTVIGNTIKSNNVGLHLYSFDGLIYHNNFIGNQLQVSLFNSVDNTWDDGYPSGGNYWSDYNGTDAYYGENATGLPPDGIGDTPYTIDANNTDRYPLMGMFSDFNATSEYHVQTICNSTISDFQFNGTAICFNVSGEDGTTGFCRICIPTALMNVTYKVYVTDTEVPYTLLACSNSTHSYLYFTYNHSTQEVIIIPEFSTWTSMLLLLIVLSVAIAITKRRLPKTSIH